MSEEELRAAIVHHLIEATPETWNEGRLEVLIDRSEDPFVIAYHIAHPAFADEMIEVTEDLTDAVLAYEAHRAGLGNLIGKLAVEFRRDERGKWAYTMDCVVV